MAAEVTYRWDVTWFEPSPRQKWKGAWGAVRRGGVPMFGRDYLPLAKALLEVR